MKKARYLLECYLHQEATDSERRVLQYLINETREAIENDIHSVAKKCFCSPSTIIRLCRKNGFSGFREIKIALANDLNFSEELKSFQSNAASVKDLETSVAHAFRENIKAIEDTYSLIDFVELEKIALLINHSPFIYLYGIGASFLVAKDLQQKMERVMKRTFLYEDTHLQLLNSTNISTDELAIIISYSGNTAEMIKIAENIKTRGAILVGITQYSHNRVAQLADFNLYVPSIEEPLRAGAGSSRVSSLSVIDALYQAYLFYADKHMIDDRILMTKNLLPKIQDI